MACRLLGKYCRVLAFSRVWELVWTYAHVPTEHRHTHVEFYMWLFQQSHSLLYKTWLDISRAPAIRVAMVTVHSAVNFGAEHTQHWLRLTLERSVQAKTFDFARLLLEHANYRPWIQSIVLEVDLLQLCNKATHL